ncbi:tetratricopeptide repeat protein [Catalinimonas niigatensis]|uniref:tetratricopeptide repeat protein n=1 Tax=Catalinimonas niigatensis TaxID=1397264 RepID=UPI0026655166|nr:tetratricopeptide repeat protein [Catalinimonas niigatensis]WPP48126.1 tetratricopeptide repeat protein [Catalinimonas niigatensis]
MKINHPITFVILLLSTTLAFSVQAQDEEQIQLAQEYDDKGEVEKAKSMYDELADKKKNVPIIHGRYFRLLMNNGYLDEAEKYIDKTLKSYPENIIYRLDAGILQMRMGKESNANKYYTDVLNEVQSDPYKVRLVAGHFIKSDMLEKAINFYEAGRPASNDPNLFALELANVYRRLNEKDKMVLEYLKYADEDEARISYVKNVLQNILTEEEDLESLSNMLLNKIQEQPDKQLYNELLIWINLQQKNFYGAFMQARAIDRRSRTDGERVMEVAGIALENQDYENALKMYEYIIEKYPRTSNYVSARRYKIKTREEMVKNRYPVAQEDIIKLIEDYQNFIDETSKSAIGPSHATLEAMRSQALLYAFYLDEKDRAIESLNEVAQHPKASRELKARCKLDMGDIYLLINQPWESTLLYSQVEKDYKEEPIGYEAKLKNAKLSYYKGEFELAQGHLDVLKLATTREIANDAMSLSVLIQNNTALDTSGTAMQDYANVELLLFQNKQEQALLKLDSMLTLYKNHDLADEIHWLMANIDMKLGKFEESLEHLNIISESFGFDILGDNALYLTGKIYEEQLQDQDKAMEIYTTFLREYAGSVYVSDVRKRLRGIRGDFNVN